MKKCPYCAEEIQDEAVKCRFCGSDVASAPMTTPAPETASPAVESPVFSHTGFRYLLGYTSDAYGVYDRQTPDSALERFPRTDQGWRQAWERYTALEPGNAPVGAAAPPAAASAPTNGMAVASLVLGILWLWWVGSVLALIFGYVSKDQIDRSGGRQGGRGLAVAGIVLGWVGVGFLLLFIVAGVATLNSGEL